MGQPNRPIQIRTLPRSQEKEGPEKPSLTAVVKLHKKKARQNMLRNYLIVGIGVILAFAVLFSDPPPAAKKPQISKKPQTQAGVDDNSPVGLVNRYLQDADARREMAMKSRELENKVTARPLLPDAPILPDSDRQLGVTMDQENSAEKVYKDLYGGDANRGPLSPDDRINLRLQEDQWLTQHEKQERKQYIQNFLKEAYDSGYAIDLDENLVVVRVRKVTSRPKETLDKVLENLARKGF